ncbi:unnamed protein product, partial [Prorocentrum cordatum]
PGHLPAPSLPASPLSPSPPPPARVARARARAGPLLLTLGAPRSAEQREACRQLFCHLRGPKLKAFLGDLTSIANGLQTTDVLLAYQLPGQEAPGPRAPITVC